MAIVLENYNGARKLIATGAPQQEIDDSVIAPDRMWSSKKLIEISTSQFETTGNPVAVSPFAYSPLGVKINFTPKQSGTGDPSPQNVRPITGYDDVTVNVRGKNLLSDENFQSSEKNGITFTKMGNGVVHIEGSSTAYADSVVVYDVPQLPPGTYYGISQYLTVVVKKASTGSNERYTALNGVRIEVGDVVQYYYFAVQASITVNGSFYIFLAPGESAFSASDFEPYQPGTSSTLTLPETIYGGTVDTVTGVGNEEWYEYTITGEENLKVFNPEHPNTFFIDITEHKNLENVAASVICSHFKFEQGEYTENTFFTQNPGAFPDVVRIVFVLEQTINSIQLAKEFFTAQASVGTPVTVCYKLATPSAFTSDGYKTIQPLEGVNTIYSNTDSVTVSGRTSWINLMEGGN